MTHPERVEGYRQPKKGRLRRDVIRVRPNSARPLNMLRARPARLCSQSLAVWGYSNGLNRCVVVYYGAG